jgi:UDP-N-acetylmuramoylalanine--D-glutamate ligase
VIDVAAYRNRRIAVFGLARSGRSAAQALVRGGARVVAWDDSKAARDAAQGLPLEDFIDGDWSDVAALVLTPGVPLTHPAPHRSVAAARAHGVPVIGDVELFLAARPAGTRVVGITGTNGKSTTTTLIAHALKEAGVPVAVGGNLGTPVLDLPALPQGGVYVLEMSSFQIDLTPGWHADVACLLNITPDHLDRHGTMDNYIAIKRRIFGRQVANDTAVIGIDDAICRAMAATLQGPHVVTVSVGGTAAVSVQDGVLMDGAAVIGDLRTAPALPGAHNWQNAGVAYGALKALGLDSAVVFGALQSFPGLAHRMETVGRLGAIRFVNDSKATNADAAAKALSSYADIYWIAGGKPKEGGIDGLDALHGHVRRAYLIGQAAEDFARTLKGKVPAVISSTLAEAVRAATADAEREGATEPVVLLSPACASYDQFKDFEQRGDTFRDLVQGLIRTRSEGAAA